MGSILDLGVNFGPQGRFWTSGSILDLGVHFGPWDRFWTLGSILDLDHFIYKQHDVHECTECFQKLNVASIYILTCTAMSKNDFFNSYRLLSYVSPSLGTN